MSGNTLRIVVVGGGYAGLACALALVKDLPSARITLIDQGERHIKATLLHQTLRRSLLHISEPFSELAQRFGFVFNQAAVGADEGFSLDDVRAWEADSAVPLADGESVPFDRLVIATGARSALQAAQYGAGCVDKQTLIEQPGEELVQAYLWELPRAQRTATVVGGGASGVQVAFELAELMRRSQRPGTVRLVDQAATLFAHMPDKVHRYVVRRMRDAHIEYLPETDFVSQSGGTVQLSNRADGSQVERPSAMTALFAGIKPYPQLFEANRFGQLETEEGPLERVFVAGDCSAYAGRGLNAATAQAAVRKGKQVAVNITRQVRRRALRSYDFRELGYVVNLGALDAVGWALSPHNVLTGLAAFGAKELVDAQYDLFVHGVDTYVV